MIVNATVARVRPAESSLDRAIQPVSICRQQQRSARDRSRKRVLHSAEVAVSSQSATDISPNISPKSETFSSVTEEPANGQDKSTEQTSVDGCHDLAEVHV